jgi:hypothetical protein
LLPGYDDVAGIPTNVDDGAKITRRAIIKVALPLLMSLGYTAPTFGALCVPLLVVLLLNIIFIFYLVGICDIESHHHVHSLVDLVGEVVVIGVEIV